MDAGDIVGGRFVLERRLGTGGMGDVWVAEQRPLGRKVALKLLKEVRPGAEQRFLREMQALARISDAHVVTVYDSGRSDDGSLFIAMELVDGPSLRDELRSRGRVSVEQSVELVRAIAAGLAAAHAQKIAHLDLKPENVVLSRTTQGRTAKILDFGIARILEKEVEPGITADDVALGTPGYMSPEQLRGVRDDVRSDLYALGVIWFELLTGRAPFTGTTAELAMKHLVEKPPRASDVPPASVPDDVETMLARLLEKDPAARPADAGALLRELDALSASSSAVTATSTRITPVSAVPAAPALPVPASRRAPMAALVAAAGAIAAVTFVAARRPPAPPAEPPAETPASSSSSSAHGPPRVAVLSLTDASSPMTGAAASDAIAGSIADLGGVRVVSSLLVARAEREAHDDPLAAATSLHVDLAVTGSVQHPAPDQVQLDVTLEDLRSGTAFGRASSPPGPFAAAVGDVVPKLKTLVARAVAPATKTARAWQPESGAGAVAHTSEAQKKPAVLHKDREQKGLAALDAPAPPHPPSVRLASADTSSYAHYLTGMKEASKDPAAAERELEEAVRIDPTSSSAWVHLAMVRTMQRGLGDPGVAEALKHCDDPMLAVRERTVCSVLVAAHSGADALDVAAKLTESAPDDPISWTLRAFVEKNPAATMTDLAHVIGMDPDLGDIGVRIVDMQTAAGHRDFALGLARAFLAMHPGDAGMRQRMAALANTDRRR